MNEPLLSICIPTYNQPSAVARLLESISSDINSEIEVFIKDDSTSEETANIVKKYASQFPITYVHGKKEGLDTAILFLTQEAKGKYIWWIGDDAVVSGGVQRVLAFLKKHDPNFVFLNFINGRGGQTQANLGTSRFFKDGSDALEQILPSRLGFISATLFKKEFALSGTELSKKYLGTDCVNLYIIYHVLSQQKKLYYMSEPVIINFPATHEDIRAVTVKNGIIHNRAMEVFGISFANILREFKGKFSNKVIRRVIKKSFGQTWRGVLVGWVGGWDTPKGKRWNMFIHFWMYPECYVALILFSLPLQVNAFCYKVYKLFFNHGKWMPQIKHK